MSISQQDISSLNRSSQGATPLNLNITSTNQSGTSGPVKLDFTIQDNAGPATGNNVIIDIINDDTGTILGTATFAYGADISSATPISEINFTSVFQPHFAAGSLLQDGGSAIFAKRDWAILTNQAFRPYDQEAVAIRWRLRLDIGGQDIDVSNIRDNDATHLILSAGWASSDILMNPKRGDIDELYVSSVSRKTSRRVMASNTYDIIRMGEDPEAVRAVNGQQPIMAVVRDTGGDWYLAEITFDGTNDYSLAIVSDVFPAVHENVRWLTVDTHTTRNVNGRRVIFTGGRQNNNNVVVWAWDNVSKYVPTVLVTESSRENTHMAVSSNGDLLYMSWHTGGTQQNRLRKLKWNGGSPELLASWVYDTARFDQAPHDYANSGILIQDTSIIARRAHFEIVGYDGTVGLTSGTIPMLYFFEGDSGGNPADVTLVEWNGTTNQWDVTTIASGWGTGAQINSGALRWNPSDGYIYTWSTVGANALRFIDPSNTVDQGQIFEDKDGAFTEYAQY